jgi:peroxiredoxin
MNTSPLPILAVVCLFVIAPAPGRAADAPDPAKATRVQVGQEAPQFEVTTLDGQKFSLTEQRGKVVLVNFFATWCGPCLQEMPHLEKEIWKKYKDKKFAMIALGREHSNDELKPFRQKNKLTFPMAGDTKREIFSRYADAYIPRSLLIDPNGRVIAQVIGYNQKEFQSLIETLAAEVAKVK